jgi:hypothetical protein
MPHVAAPSDVSARLGVPSTTLTVLPSRVYRHGGQGRSFDGSGSGGTAGAGASFHVVPVGVVGEDAKRLERLSEARGKNAAAVVSELLLEADRSGA